LDKFYLTGVQHLMQSIIQFDSSFFRLINGQWHNAFFDWLMPWLRNSSVWVPLYLFILLFAAINYKKNAGWFILFAVLTAIMSDFISSTLIKSNFFRLRPCNDSSLADSIRVLVGYRPQSSSFTSSHAVNHFALATYLYITLKKQLGKKMLWWFAWAFSIAYAQVYVGVHYPLDVICGAIIGILIGYLPGQLVNKRYILT
jgi:membrane-associated phospholipid phosphatase